MRFSEKELDTERELAFSHLARAFLAILSLLPFHNDRSFASSFLPLFTVPSLFGLVNNYSSSPFDNQQANMEGE